MEEECCPVVQWRCFKPRPLQSVCGCVLGMNPELILRVKLSVHKCGCVSYCRSEWAGGTETPLKSEEEDGCRSDCMHTNQKQRLTCQITVLPSLQGHCSQPEHVHWHHLRLSQNWPRGWEGEAGLVRSRNAQSCFGLKLKPWFWYQLLITYLLHAYYLLFICIKWESISVSFGWYLCLLLYSSATRTFLCVFVN